MKILITDKMADEAIQLLKDAGHDVTFDEMDGDTLLKEIPKEKESEIKGYKSHTKMATFPVVEYS